MLYEGLVGVLTEASKKLSNKRRKHSNQPGWNDHVADLHKDARECFVMWCNNGKPRQGWIFDLMHQTRSQFNLFPLIPACTARPGLPLYPPETAFLESPYYRPQTASIADRHHPTNFHSVTYTQTDDAAFEAGSDNDHKSFLRMRVIFKVEYQAELFRFRRVLDDILSSFDVF